MQAQVVRAAFEQCRRDGPADGFADQWQVAVIQLVLKRFGARADDGLAAAQQGRQQVREGLARTGTGFDHEFVRIRDGFGDGFGHPRLARARLETRQ